MKFFIHRFSLSLLALALLTPADAFSADSAVQADVIVYGGTPAGIAAAIAAARHGHTVALIDINAHVGGMMSGGLVDTDIGDRATVGGISDAFFKRMSAYYSGKYGMDSKQFKACKDGNKFEPHVAENLFEEMLKEQPKVKLWRQHRFSSLTMEGGKVTSVVMDDIANKNSRTFTGQVFIDASYEGDVMAHAGIPYRVGRESRAEFGEYLAGINMGPDSILGLGDHRTQAYNYRVSITSDTQNRVLFPKPEAYDPQPWRETSGVRVLKNNITSFAGLYVNAAGKAGPNDKLDTNWGDLLGGSESYPEADWPTRDRIAARHRDYFLSMLYYLQNDPELPESFRKEAQTWGLPKDEFADNGHFPFQLYVREGRRMLGRYVLREQDLTQNRYKPDGICTGSYGIDCHVVQRLVHEGKRVSENTRHVSVHNYDIPYACLTPHEPQNLLVPVCLSATHVAYASLRMEPVYMMLGEAAGSAAHLAITNQVTVQNVNVDSLRDILKKGGAILDAGYAPPVKIIWSPSNPKAGEAVKLSFESTAKLKDPIKEVCWDVTGDGAVASREADMTHSFAMEKTHTVSLLVEDMAGLRTLVSAEIPVGAATKKDVTMDEFDAELSGRWSGTYPEISGPGKERLADVFFGPGIHRDVVLKGEKVPVRVRFKPTIPHAGRYQLCIGFRAAKDLASNLPITIQHAKGTDKLLFNQRVKTTPFNFAPVGEFTFKAGSESFVDISNDEADGGMYIDGMRWVWLGE